MLEKHVGFNNEKLSNKLFLYFIVVGIANVIFKIPYLSFSSFWYDEIISVQSASLDFGHIKHVSEWDKNPPFYYYCLSVWIKLFTNSEFCVRLLSVIFSSLAAGVLFLFSNKYFNKRTAIIVSFLYLSSNALFFYAHEARAYSLVVLLALLSTYTFFELKDKPTLKTILLLGLLNFLLIYTHYISGFVILFQCILVLVFFNKKAKLNFLYGLLVMLFFVVLRFTKKQALLIIMFNNKEDVFWLQKSNFNYLLETLNVFFFDIWYVIPIMVIIVLSIFFVIYNKIKEMNFVLLYCVCIGFGSLVTLFFLGKITPIFLDRYLIFIIPYILLLIGFALSLIKLKNIAVTLSVVFFIFSAFKINYKTDKGMDYRSVVSFVKLIKTNDDLVIVKTKDVRPLFGYYYDRNFLKDKKSELPKEENIIFCDNWDDVKLDVNLYKRIIVIDSFHDLNPDEKDFVAKLSQKKKYHSESNFYKGVRISFYK